MFTPFYSALLSQLLFMEQRTCVREGLISVITSPEKGRYLQGHDAVLALVWPVYRGGKLGPR